MYYAVIVQMKGITCNRYIGRDYNRAIITALRFNKKYTCQIYIEEWEDGICVNSRRFIPEDGE